VQIDLLRAADGFRRKGIELVRTSDESRPYRLEVDRGIGVLRVSDMRRLSPDELALELDDVRSRGVKQLLIDLRNVAELDPRDVAPIGGLFSSGPLLQLMDRDGEIVESVEIGRSETAWQGEIVVLVNGATAGAAEALATLVQQDLGGEVVGESTYGLGSEAKLYEMPDGSGLLVSASIWETPAGGRWNGEGVEPDEVIRGSGGDYEARMADQLRQALEFVERRNTPEPPPATGA
jgi:carboxyl-terminal processing protease